MRPTPPKHPKQHFTNNTTHHPPKTDLLTALPPELSLKVLRFAATPPTDGHVTIAAARSTCSIWKKLCADDHLWHDMCKGRGYIQKDATLREEAKCLLPVLVLPFVNDTKGGKGLNGGNERKGGNKKWKTIATEPTNDQTPIPPPLPPLPAGKDGDWRRYFKERYLLDQNWSKGRHVQRSMYGHMDVILAVRVWGDYVVSGSRNGWVKCFDAGNGTEVWSAQMHSGGVSCIFTEGEVLYTGSWDATIKVWHRAALTPTPQPDSPTLTLTHAHPTICMSANPTLLVSGTVEGSVYLWDPTTGTPLSIFNPNPPTAELVGCIDFDSLHVYSGAHNSISIWERETGKLLRRVDAHGKVVTALRVDGGRMVSGSEDGDVKVWDVGGAGKGVVGFVGKLEGHTEGVRCLQTWGDKLVTGSYDKVK